MGWQAARVGLPEAGFMVILGRMVESDTCLKNKRVQYFGCCFSGSLGLLKGAKQASDFKQYVYGFCNSKALLCTGHLPAQVRWVFAEDAPWHMLLKSFRQPCYLIPILKNKLFSNSSK